MKIKKFSALVLGALLSTLPALGQTTIRVAPLISEEPYRQDLANLITAKLISHLAQSGIPVVEPESDAKTDATLMVTYAVQERDGHIHIGGAIRLVNSEGKVLWADDVNNSVFARSASSSFAENVARKVEEFLAKQKR